MLNDFESITEDLKPFEKDVVLPMIVKNFKLKIKKGQIGKTNVVSSEAICNGISSTQESYILKPVRLRIMIGMIRQLDYVPALCSCSKGYYVAATMSELDGCIESLEQRIRQQTRIVDSLRRQKEVIQTNPDK